MPSYEKKQFVREENFDLKNSNDKRVVEEFEKELADYEKREFVFMKGTTFERTLKGLDLYFHENGFLCYTQEYPLGIVGGSLSEYELLKRKWIAIKALRASREKAKGHEDDRTKSLLKDVETMMQGKKVSVAA